MRPRGRLPRLLERDRLDRLAVLQARRSGAVGAPLHALADGLARLDDLAKERVGAEAEDAGRVRGRGAGLHGSQHGEPTAMPWSLGRGFAAAGRTSVVRRRCYP